MRLDSFADKRIQTCKGENRVGTRLDVPWLPVTPDEKEAVQEQLGRVLASHAFRNSQRYPALLRYVVEQTLAGASDQLKERTLGVAVFRRAPDYDTNADPVVRVTAGEVRKRLAQYYGEHGSELRIALPSGSYVPQFQPALLVEDVLVTADPYVSFELGSPVTAEGEPELLPPLSLVDEAATTAAEPFRASRSRSWFIIAAALLLLAAAVGALWTASAQQDALQQFWSPVVSAQQTPMLVLGGRMAVYLASDGTPLAGGTSLADGTTLVDGAPLSAAKPRDSASRRGFYTAETFAPQERINTITIGDALSFARVASLISRRGFSYTGTSAELTSLEELRAQPSVLFGAYNNAWTLHAADRLRFRLRFDEPPGYSHYVWIEDTAKGATARWMVDCRQPMRTVPRDYAIVARYLNPETEQEMVLVAGLRESGTTAASEFIASNRYLQELNAFAPTSGWAKRNLEAVIETEVVGGRSGPPRVVAAAFW